MGPDCGAGAKAPRLPGHRFHGDPGGTVHQGDGPACREDRRRGSAARPHDSVCGPADRRDGPSLRLRGRYPGSAPLSDDSQLGPHPALSPRDPASVGRSPPRSQAFASIPSTLYASSRIRRRYTVVEPVPHRIGFVPLNHARPRQSGRTTQTRAASLRIGPSVRKWDWLRSVKSAPIRPSRR